MDVELVAVLGTNGFGAGGESLRVSTAERRQQSHGNQGAQLRYGVASHQHRRRFCCIVPLRRNFPDRQEIARMPKDRGRSSTVTWFDRAEHSETSTDLLASASIEL